ncbi:MAG: CarD family transcriptional regulator [Hyphomonadaceae bacterium]
MAKKKTETAEMAFKIGQNVVYPAHGVGMVKGIEKQTLAGMDLEVYTVSFDQDKMILRVPTNRAVASGMRALAGTKLVDDALKTLGGRARIKRTMWSRRAQEYEAKINSGSLISIAEVVRDLHRAQDQPEQSYSERQLYENALDRMARELAAVENIERDKAMDKLAKSLAKKKAVIAAAAAAAEAEAEAAASAA